MTDIKITVEIRDEQAREGLQRILERQSAQGMQRLNKQLGIHMVNAAQDRFHQERGPDGLPWQPLSPATVRKRMKSGRSALAILRENGYLSGSISYTATPEVLTVGAATPYAMIHQFGGTIEKKASSRYMV